MRTHIDWYVYNKNINRYVHEYIYKNVYVYND